MDKSEDMNTQEYIQNKLKIDKYRLRGPMPIELPNFNRDDLAKLFNELGFKKGAEIGVAEGHYSEILCQSIPDLELLAVDPWIRYADNPRAHSTEHQIFSYNETKRRLAPYPKAKMVQAMSMDAVRDVANESLDFAYVDGHHSFDYVMSDLIEWSKRVRSGGIIAGDDYFEMKWGGVIQAVQAYTQAHEIHPWYLIQAPRSVDYFWCKP